MVFSNECLQVFCHITWRYFTRVGWKLHKVKTNMVYFSTQFALHTHISPIGLIAMGSHSWRSICPDGKKSSTGGIILTINTIGIILTINMATLYCLQKMKNLCNAKYIHTMHKPYEIEKIQTCFIMAKSLAEIAWD